MYMPSETCREQIVEIVIRNMISTSGAMSDFEAGLKL